MSPGWNVFPDTEDSPLNAVFDTTTSGLSTFIITSLPATTFVISVVPSGKSGITNSYTIINPFAGISTSVPGDLNSSDFFSAANPLMIVISSNPIYVVPFTLFPSIKLSYN